MNGILNGGKTLREKGTRQHTFLFLKNTKKFAWIYWKKLLLQALATLYFIDLLTCRSSP